MSELESQEERLVVPTRMTSIKIYRLSLRHKNGHLEHEAVERESDMSSDLFNALVAAIASKHDAVIEDILELTT